MHKYAKYIFVSVFLYLLSVNKKDTTGGASLSKVWQVAVVFLLFKEQWPSLEVKAIVKRKGGCYVRDKRAENDVAKWHGERMEGIIWYSQDLSFTVNAIQHQTRFHSFSLKVFVTFQPFSLLLLCAVVFSTWGDGHSSNPWKIKMRRTYVYF